MGIDLNNNDLCTIEIDHLTKYDAFGVNRDQVMVVKIWFKIHANVSNFEETSPKPYKLLLIFFISFVTNAKSRHANIY